MIAYKPRHETPDPRPAQRRRRQADRDRMTRARRQAELEAGALHILGVRPIMIAYIPLVVSLAGLLTYAIASNPKVAEAGLIAYGCGLLVTLFALAAHTVRFLAP